MSEKIKLSLSRPIKAHGEDVTLLEFREPNGDDLIACGVPFATDPSGRNVILPAETYACISKLAGIPMSSAKMLAMNDFFKAWGVVMGFFGNGASQTN